MNGMLEHANISVKDVDEAVRFFTTAFPHWKVRGTGGEPPAHWVHLGTDDQYLCLGAPDNHDSRTQGHRGYGVNHIGFVVDDADAVLLGRETIFRDGSSTPGSTKGSRRTRTSPASVST